LRPPDRGIARQPELLISKLTISPRLAVVVPMTVAFKFIKQPRVDAKDAARFREYGVQLAPGGR